MTQKCMAQQECFEQLLDLIRLKDKSLLEREPIKSAVKQDYLHLLAACFALDKNGKRIINNLEDAEHKIEHKYVGYLLYQMGIYTKVAGQLISISVPNEITAASMLQVAQSIFRKNILDINYSVFLQFMCEIPQFEKYARCLLDIGYFPVAPLIVEERGRKLLDSLIEIPLNQNRAELAAYCRNALLLFHVDKKDELNFFVERFSLALSSILTSGFTSESTAAFLHAQKQLENKLKSNPYVGIIANEDVIRITRKVFNYSAAIGVIGDAIGLGMVIGFIHPAAPILLLAMGATILLVSTTLLLISLVVVKLSQENPLEPAVAAQNVLKTGVNEYNFFNKRFNEESKQPIGDFVIVLEDLRINSF